MAGLPAISVDLAGRKLRNQRAPCIYGNVLDAGVGRPVPGAWQHRNGTGRKSKQIERPVVRRHVRVQNVYTTFKPQGVSNLVCGDSDEVILTAAIPSAGLKSNEKLLLKVILASVPA